MLSSRKKVGITTDIVLIDIINFSKLNSSQQLEIITFITRSYKKMILKMLENSNLSLERLVLGFISTGDGFYCVLNPAMQGYGAILGMSFNHFSDKISQKYPYFQGIRIGVHNGVVNEFRDILNNKNFIGEGLNDCSRFLELKNFTISTVMVSSSAYESLKNFLSTHRDFDALLAQRGFKHSNYYTFHDKHGKELQGRLIWLRESGIINPPHPKFMTRKGKA